jgi:hypothetical protein
MPTVLGKFRVYASGGQMIGAQRLGEDEMFGRHVIPELMKRKRRAPAARRAARA